MSIEELEECGKTALLEAKMVIRTESGCLETEWVDAQGKHVAWCLGVPSLCSNSPADKKCRCLHFGFYWRQLHNRSDWAIYDEEIVADERLEAWINQQPLVAAECISLGQFATRGTWHTAKKRWMWGPKQDRR